MPSHPLKIYHPFQLDYFFVIHLRTSLDPFFMNNLTSLCTIDLIILHPTTPAKESGSQQLFVLEPEIQVRFHSVSVRFRLQSTKFLLFICLYNGDSEATSNKQLFYSSIAMQSKSRCSHRRNVVMELSMVTAPSFVGPSRRPSCSCSCSPSS